MVRECDKIPLEHFIKEFSIRNIHLISLYVDKKNKSEIINLISQNKDRFRRAVYVLLQGTYNNDLYGKENISKKTKNITAFKFKRRKSSNYRIYCKEYIDELNLNTKNVVMIAVHNKKTQKFDNKTKTIITKISKYDYSLKKQK